MPGTAVAAKRKPVRRGRSKSASAEMLAEKRRLAARIRGKYAWIPYSSEAFRNDTLREIELENRA